MTKPRKASEQRPVTEDRKIAAMDTHGGAIGRKHDRPLQRLARCVGLMPGESEMSVFQPASIVGLKEMGRHARSAVVCVTVGLLMISTIARSTLATAACPGDCNGDDEVSVDEITLIVNITLGIQPISSCPIFSQQPDVVDIVLAVNAALMGCPQATPTPTASRTPFPTRTPVVFQAAEGSRIFYSEGAGAPIEEPLSGTFAFRLLGSLEPQFYNLDVTDVNLSSPQFSVVAQTPGQSGSVRMGLSCDSIAFMDLQVFVNEEPSVIAGSALVASCPVDIVSIQPFEICTGRPDPCDSIRAGIRPGYSLTIIPVVQ